uniref:Tetraspanin n=1 Tax=Erpetoichthys calabaricus TaxID=27687 RepID=A0A8C4S1U5_ERPCA
MLFLSIFYKQFTNPKHIPLFFFILQHPCSFLGSSALITAFLPFDFTFLNITFYLCFLFFLHLKGLHHIMITNTLVYSGIFVILFGGVILFLLGFLGCYGALRENRVLLMVFFILILVIFILEIIGVILALAFEKQVKGEFFTSELKKNFKGDNTTDIFSQTWCTIMIVVGCCGVQGPEDFGNSSLFNKLYPDTKVPEACCKRMNKMIKMLYISQQGCYNYMDESLKKYIHIAGACSISVLCLEAMQKINVCVYWTPEAKKCCSIKGRVF